MENTINFENNPLGMTVLNMMMLMNNKVNTNPTKNLIFSKCREILNEVLYNPNQINYLDFTVTFDSIGDKCVIIPNNMVTALWFCGVFPFDVEQVMRENIFYVEEGYYIYYKNKKLKFFKNE